MGHVAYAGAATDLRALNAIEASTMATIRHEATVSAEEGPSPPPRLHATSVQAPYDLHAASKHRRGGALTLLTER